MAEQSAVPEIDDVNLDFLDGPEAPEVEESPLDLQPVDPVVPTQEQALEMLRVAAQTPEGRKILGLAAGQQGVSGVYRRDYQGDSNLDVTGGKEVLHPVDFMPLPPAYVTKFVSKDGGKTDYAQPFYRPEKRSAPKRGENGKIVQSEDGVQIFEDQWVDVLADPGAALDAKGNPILTDEYKLFLDRKLEGRSLASNVRSDIQAGNFVANDPGVGV
jgi:hypothetical protein